MSIIEEKCKQKGVRLTDQRKVIAKILSESKEVYGSKVHPDVDELHKRVTALDDKISDDHNHLIDINSGEIVEFVDKDIEELQKKIAKKLGYNLVDHKLELYGSKIKK